MRCLTGERNALALPFLCRPGSLLVCVAKFQVPLVYVAFIGQILVCHYKEDMSAMQPARRYTASSGVSSNRHLTFDPADAKSVTAARLHVGEQLLTPTGDRPRLSAFLRGTQF